MIDKPVLVAGEQTSPTRSLEAYLAALQGHGGSTAPTERMMGLPKAQRPIECKKCTRRFMTPEDLGKHAAAKHPAVAAHFIAKWW